MGNTPRPIRRCSSWRPDSRAADGVERIRLGHDGDVDAGLLEFDDAVDGFVEAARIVQSDSDSHERHLITRRMAASRRGAFAEFASRVADCYTCYILLRN